MAWPLVIMAASAIYSGISSYSQGRANSRAAQAYADWNATNLMVFGTWQADAITKFSRFNAELTLRGAAANAGNALAVAQYNADLQDLVAEHNSTLLLDEATGVWKAEKLDEKILDQKIAQIAGEQIAGFAASNVITNEGTPLEAVLDTKTQGEFERHIMRYNADEQARTLLNAATQGEWEADLAGSQMVYEAEMAGMNAMNSARVTAAGMLAQGKYDAIMAKYGASQNAQKVGIEGSFQASQYSRAGSQALVSSLFNAASTVVSASGRSYVPSTSGLSGSGSSYNYNPVASNTSNFMSNYSFYNTNYGSLLTN